MQSLITRTWILALRTKAKDLDHQVKAKAKDLRYQSQGLGFWLKEPRPRTNITGERVNYA